MKKWIISAVIVLAVIIVAANSMYTVKENEYACTFRFSEIVGVQDKAGLHFKIPFVDTVQKFPRTTMIYDIPPSPVYTSDKQQMNVDCYLLWSISDARQFYRSLGTTAEAESRLNAITYNALKNTISTLAQADIINMEDGAKRNEIYESITGVVDKQTREYGICVEDVKIKQFDLPDSNLEAVYGRMISERNQIAEKHTAEGNKEASTIRSEVDKTVNIAISDAKAQAAQLEAEGEAEYMRLLAEAYDTQSKKDFYEFMLALDALKNSLTGEEKTIILDADSPLAQILMGN